MIQKLDPDLQHHHRIMLSKHRQYFYTYEKAQDQFLREPTAMESIIITTTPTRCTLH